MTRQEAARRTRVLRQIAKQILDLLEANDLDDDALLKAADKLGDDYRLALGGVMALVYEEAGGVTVERPYGVGEDGR